MQRVAGGKRKRGPRVEHVQTTSPGGATEQACRPSRARYHGLRLTGGRAALRLVPGYCLGAPPGAYLGMLRAIHIVRCECTDETSVRVVSGIQMLITRLVAQEIPILNVQTPAADAAVLACPTTYQPRRIPAPGTIE